MGKPYSFIPLLKTQPHKNNKKSDLKGKINLTIEVLNAVHISKDSYDMTEKNVVYKQFFRIGDNYAIPATSLKGMIRSFAEMVSYSCISPSKITSNNLPYYKKKSCKVPNPKFKTEDPMCIICDIFGAMGKGSKIKISNFTHEKDTGKVSIQGLPTLRGPHADEAHIYLDEDKKFKGYKIYNHGISSILKSGDYTCECLTKGAIFTGKILYENFDEEELELLCYSLGLCDDFNHKLGYGKPAYYGSVKISCDNEEYVKYAKAYMDKAPKDIKDNIKLLQENYSYKNAKKQPDYEENSY